MIHIKGRIKSFKKRFRAKLKKFAKVRLAEHMLPPHFEKVVSCGLCRSAEQKIIDEKGNILQCKKCGLKFMSPRPTQKDISKIYDWSYSNCLGWGRVKPEAQLMYERRFNFFKKFVNGGKILDIGAGLGIFLAKAKMTNRWQCFGTEISKYAVEFAKKEFDIELALGQLEDLAFPEKFFDAVCFWHVLEHLPHPSKAIKETARILKDDGFLFIAVPNDSWLGRRQFFKNAFKKAVNCLPIKKKLRLKKMYPEIDEEGNKHLLYFTPYTLKKFLEKYGFRIRKHSVDYDYEESNPKLERKYKFELLLCHLTGINFSNAILVAAQKK